MSSEFSVRITPSFVEGLLLAVNAISDAALAVEGPGCLRTKMMRVCRNHDLNSTLFSASGQHRVASTDRGPARVLGSSEPLVELLRQMAGELEPGVLFTVPFATQQAMGADVGKAVRAARLDRGAATALALHNDSLDGDWIDGWQAVLQALAAHLPLVGDKEPGSVAVVGNMFWRNEGDARGDVEQLRLLVESLGLRLASVWLSGESTRQLQDAAKAQVILSLPWGREAARTLAARTGAQLVECPLPLGPDACARFLRAVGECTGTGAQAQQVAQEQETALAQTLAAPLALHSDDMSVCVLADPHLAAALVECLEALGVAVPLVAVLRVPGRFARGLEPDDRTVLLDPSFEAWEEALAAAHADGPVQVALASGLSEVACHKAGVELVELGYPCQLTHFLRPSPVLGYGGTVHLAQRVVNAYARRMAADQMNQAARWYRDL